MYDSGHTVNHFSEHVGKNARFDRVVRLQDCKCNHQILARLQDCTIARLQDVAGGLGGNLTITHSMPWGLGGGVTIQGPLGGSVAIPSSFRMQLQKAPKIARLQDCKIARCCRGSWRQTYNRAQCALGSWRESYNLRHAVPDCKIAAKTPGKILQSCNLAILQS